jgi:DNA (cytosine-5)-methyltransferase 1
VPQVKLTTLDSLEVCAGAGGQALGYEQAGFEHRALVEIEPPFCETLRLNRPKWNVIQSDLRVFKEGAKSFKGVDIFTGGLPCPPFSVAGK